MTPSTLEAVISKVLNSTLTSQHVEFLWHAGEPLLAGIPFYRTALSLIEKHNSAQRKIKNTIQTNGVLLSDEWCKFLKENDFGVGISIDGPQSLHDANRVNWAGKGTFTQVMSGYNRLRDAGIAPGALSVITANTLSYPDQLFEFYIENGFEWVGFNIEEIENDNKTSSFQRNTGSNWHFQKKAYRRFMRRFFELWFNSDKTFIVREFIDISRIIASTQNDSQYIPVPDEVKPLNFLTIDKNGNITPFSPEFAGSVAPSYNNFVIGNIHTADLDTLKYNETFMDISNDITAGVRNCAKTCKYFGLCGSGFLSNKFTENSSLESTETSACILHRQILVDVIIEGLSERPPDSFKQPGPMLHELADH